MSLYSCLSQLELWEEDLKETGKNITSEDFTIARTTFEKNDTF
jgi:hypothetical protein